jgi:hypothetical protein
VRLSAGDGFTGEHAIFPLCSLCAVVKIFFAGDMEAEPNTENAEKEQKGSKLWRESYLRG